MALTTAQSGLVARDITRVIASGALNANPVYPQLCTVVPSEGEDEKYAWIGALPGMREWFGERRFEQLRAADYVLPNRHWESSLLTPKTKIEDDRTGLMRVSYSQLGAEAAYHPDELLFLEAINQGDSMISWDGQPFYDTAHEWGDSGQQSNIVTITGVSDPTNPTAEEWKAAFHAALTRMQSFRNDQGKPFLRPRVQRGIDNLVVTMPLAHQESANRALEQTIAVEGTVATSNFLLERPQLMTVQYHGANYTAGSDSRFFLHYTGGAIRPFIFQNRQRLRVQTKGPEDIEHKDYKSMTEARYNVGFLAWFYSIQVNLEV